MQYYACGRGWYEIFVSLYVLAGDGDLSVWKGIAQDALIMNIDDLLCVGATDNILVSSTIGRNKLLIPGEVISSIINGTEELLAELRGLE